MGRYSHLVDKPQPKTPVRAAPKKAGKYAGLSATFDVQALGNQLANTGKAVRAAVQDAAHGRKPAPRAAPASSSTRSSGPAPTRPPDRSAKIASVLQGAASSGKDPRQALAEGGFLPPSVAAPPGSALAHMKEQADAHHGGSILGNLAGDFLDVATGIPSGVVLAGKNIGATFAAPYGYGAQALHVPLPGAGGAREFTRHVARLDKTAGQAIAADYEHRWGPAASAFKDIVTGQNDRIAHDVHQLNARLKEHPGLAAMDVGSAVTLAGGGTAAAARLIGRLAPDTRLGAALGEAGSRSLLPGGTRYRPPRVLTQRVGENAGEATTLTKTLRPLTPNPLTRPLQRAFYSVTQRAGKAVGRYGAENADLGGTRAAAAYVARKVGPEGQFQREAARQARDLRLEFQNKAARHTGDLAQGYTKASRLLRSTVGRDLVGRKSEEAALYLHMKGLLDVPGLSPAEARDRLVATQRAEQAARPGIRKAASLRVIQSFADIPDALLDLKTAPAALRQAVEEGRVLAGKSTARMVAAGKITPETAAATAARPGEIIHGGSRFDRAAGGFTIPDPMSPSGRGVYLPDIPVDRLSKTAAKAAGTFGRITAEPVKQSHGYLLLTGNLVTDARLPVYAAHKAVAASLHPQFVDDFVKRFAARDGGPQGRIVTGPRAVEAARADPGTVVLMSRRALLDGLRRGEDLQPGKYLQDHEVAGAFLSEESAARALAGGAANDVIAVPKAAADTIRASMTAPSTIVRGLDSALNAWRSGILAFAPRWYVNNLFGNTLQFGLLAGKDVGAIRQAARPEFRHAIPERIAASTLARDARGAAGARIGASQSRLGSAAQAGFEFNQGLEAAIRRGAYLASAKQLLRKEGEKTRTRGPRAPVSNEDLARLVEDMPLEVKAEAIHRAELFMGDYQRLSHFERSVLRRVFPFYSWIRVIGKLTATLPFHHPLRAQALTIASRMGTAAESPQDAILPFFQRGMVHLPGGLAIRTQGANPFTTLAGADAALGTGDLAAAVNEVASGSVSPLLQAGVQQISGRNLFTGQDFTAPPGWHGISQPFGKRPEKFNPATGRFEPADIKPGLVQSLIEDIPGVSTARDIVSQGRRPFDVASTQDLLLNALNGGKPDWRLYQRPPRNAPGTRRIPFLSAVGSFTGLPIVSEDLAAQLQAYRDNLRSGMLAERGTARDVKRATRGR